MVVCHIHSAHFRSAVCTLLIATPPVDFDGILDMIDHLRPREPARC